MDLKRWIARRESDWQQLEQLLRIVERRGIRSLSATEVKNLTSLYRSVSADLARAQTIAGAASLMQNLQNLTARAYSQIYQGSRHQEWQAAWYFYRWGLPETLRRNWWYIFVATALFMAGAVVAWWYAWADPLFLAAVVPQQLIKMVQDEGKLWMGSIVGIEPLASSNIMINNLSVSFAAMGGGMVAGLYTIYILVYNGLHIGAIASLVGQNNLAFPFWAFVFPHGSLELPAIFIAGGAGLLIGRAIVFPGRFRRVDALKHYGQQAAQLLFAVVPLLIGAAVIEGFISPNPAIPDSLKYLIGILLFSALLSYAQRSPTS